MQNENWLKINWWTPKSQELSRIFMLELNAQHKMSQLQIYNNNIQLNRNTMNHLYLYMPG